MMMPGMLAMLVGHLVLVHDNPPLSLNLVKSNLKSEASHHRKVKGLSDISGAYRPPSLGVQKV